MYLWAQIWVKFLGGCAVRDAKCSYYCYIFLKNFTEKLFEKYNPVCLRLNYIEIVMFNNLSNAE